MSHLFDVDVMVIPCVFMRVDMDSSHSQDWLLMEHFGGPVACLPFGPGLPFLPLLPGSPIDISGGRMWKAQHRSYIKCLEG